MINYATVGSNKLEQALPFYDALTPAIRMNPLYDHPSGGRIYRSPEGSLFGVLHPNDGQPATVGNGTMIGFQLRSVDEVAAFHAKVLDLGGTSEGTPGPRARARTRSEPSDGSCGCYG